jgi:hypothetical protein
VGVGLCGARSTGFGSGVPHVRPIAERAVNNNAADCPTAAYSWRLAPHDPVALALLRGLPALRPARMRRSRHPLGCACIQRRLAAARPLYGLRPQGRDDPASELGRRRRELRAVPGR